MLRAFFTFILNTVAPPRKTETLVASLSHEELEGLVMPGESVGVLPYRDERVRALVWELKYYKHTTAARLAGALVSDPLIAIASEEIGKPLLVPIPMHTSRLRVRGYNQTELLCEAALTHMADMYEYVPKVLVRIKNTPQQQGLAKKIRINNINGSMTVKNPWMVSGRACVVVDDVSTTGATFTEAKRALRAAGALRVECVALAH